MDTREAIGVIAVSLVPFLVSVGAALSVGGPGNGHFSPTLFRF
ncbi:hypothetical protein ACVIIW_006313 [Bradyrhizobium sp. USDA 4449]